MVGGHDLIIGRGTEWHGYVLYGDDQASMVHTIERPNAPINASGGTPTQSGGVYDVRDSQGDKSIAHLNWEQGAGQLSLDAEDSIPSRYHSSKGFDIHKQGQLTLLRNKVDTKKQNTAGPIFSCMGYVWLGMTQPGASTSLYYGDVTSTGETWYAATISGTAPTATISDFTTDGSHVYFCVPTGSETGVWRNNVTSGGVYEWAPATFRKLSAAGASNKIYKIAYCNGIVFAATTSNAGLLKVTDATYDVVTPAFLNVDNTTVALVASGNAVYWVVSQNGKSFVYEIAYDPDLQTATTRQLTEMTDGFIATCATAVLGKLFVGGYFTTGSTSGVGKGAVYQIDTDTGEFSPLFELGDYPEDTTVPSSTDNDNRVQAITASHKDLFILTNKNCWRWDLDNGGYSHVWDHKGNGVTALITQFNEGSTISWDGTSQYVPTSHWSPFPNEWDINYDSTPDADWLADYWTGKWTETSGVARYTGTSAQVWTCTPTGTENLSNASGTTLHVKMASGRTGNWWLNIADGTKQAKFVVVGGSVYLQRYTYPEHYGPYLVWNYDIDGEGTGGWETVTGWHKETSGTKYWSLDATPENYRIANDGNMLALTMGEGATELYFHLHGDSAEVWNLNQVPVLTTTSVRTTTDDEISIVWENGSNIDLLELNSQGYSANVVTSEYNFHPAICKHNGNVMAVYSSSDANKTLSFNSITNANPTRITTSLTTDGASVNHGLTTGDYVYISGAATSNDINGYQVVTKYDNTSFTVPVNVSSHTNHNGTVKFTTDSGVTKQGSTLYTDAWLKTSHSTFHSGSMMKDFRYIEVMHDPLPDGVTIAASWTIDGEGGGSTGTTTSTRTKIPIGKRGYGIDATLEVSSTGNNVVIKGFNVVWDFVKVPKHIYHLDCRPSNLWKENPEEAIAFLFECAEYTAEFEDRYNGLYTGVIESLEYKQAPRAIGEAPCGTVKIEVREVI